MEAFNITRKEIILKNILLLADKFNFIERATVPIFIPVSIQQGLIVTTLIVQVYLILKNMNTLQNIVCIMTLHFTIHYVHATTLIVKVLCDSEKHEDIHNEYILPHMMYYRNVKMTNTK